ncbi:MAG TPA: FecR domain-containing protein [Rhizomicrobium sp.]|nr:FecR domain-containing protein [Rhizomicrobium sp.]
MSSAQEQYRQGDAIRAEAAARLLRRNESVNWGETEQSELDAWLAQSLAHRVAYLRLDAAWSSADRLAALHPAPEQVPARPWSWPILLRIAAALIVAAGLSTAASRIFTQPPERTFATPVGGRETISFSDGSKIELNTDTVLRARMTTGERIVWLDKGEAYFYIKHDAARPFSVMADGHRITDLGTSFLVRRDSGSLEVALVEGRARVESETMVMPSQSALLAPGDVVLATANSMSMEKKSSNDLADALAWRRGIIVFHRTQLADVAREYNRYNRTKLVIADAALAHRTISASLPATDLNAFARVARNFFGLRVERSGDEIVISR